MLGLPVTQVTLSADIDEPTPHSARFPRTVRGLRVLTHTDFGANADKARQMRSIWRAFFIYAYL